MGIDHTPILFYGFAIPEDVEKKWLIEDQHSYPIVYYGQKKGIIYPEVPFVGNEEIYNQYWKEIDKLEIDCRILPYGTYTCGLHAVCVQSSLFKGWTFDCLKIEKIEISANWDDQIKSYCEVMDIPYQQPTWCLVTLCG